MPLLCVGERRSPTQIEDGEDVGGECTSIWQETTDSILLDIFSFLDATNLCHAACVCKAWKRVAYDETLWRSLLRRSVDNLNCVLPVGRHCWRNEYERIHYRVPLILSETLTEHTDEVLHVSFAHGGHLFSTTSKDSTLKNTMQTKSSKCKKFKVSEDDHVTCLTCTQCISTTPCSVCSSWSEGIGLSSSVKV